MLRSESLQPVRSLFDEFWPDSLARLKQSVEAAHPRRQGETDVISSSVRIAAPPEVVFPFTDPQLMVTWVGERVDLDARPGGTFAVDFGPTAARGSYVAVEPPRRVVFTWGIPEDTAMPPGSSRWRLSSWPRAPTPCETSPIATSRCREHAHLQGWERCLRELVMALPH